ncbi:MAG TPA: hypothetical protein VH477_11600 [Bryobacteraceae bacterium]|jgi:anti-sigma factor RsiW
MFTSSRRRLERHNHVSDDDVLRFVDGELEGGRSADIRGHFETCWKCRTRMLDFENTIVHFVHFQQKLSERTIPPITGPLAQLKARLEARVQERRAKPRGVFPFPVLSLSAAAVFVVVLAVIFLQLSNRPASRALRSYAFEPVPVLTPGQAVSISRQQVCSSDSTTTPRVAAPALRKRVFEAYGMANAPEQDFEVDFLITPELGGAETMRNLWPEPYYNTVWNAHVKDQLEVRLRDLVCSGQLDIRTAQRDLSDGWVAAYQRYFKSQAPVRDQTPVALLFAFFKQP